MEIAELEAQARDPNAPWFFSGYRVCHHSNDACCRGFWDHHRDAFAAGQIAQRLGLVSFVDEDDRGAGETIASHVNVKG